MRVAGEGGEERRLRGGHLGPAVERGARMVQVRDARRLGELRPWCQGSRCQDHLYIERQLTEQLVHVVHGLKHHAMSVSAPMKVS